MIMAGAYCHPPGTRAHLPRGVERAPDREDTAAGVDELGPEQVSEERRD